MIANTTTSRLILMTVPLRFFPEPKQQRSRSNSTTSQANTTREVTPMEINTEHFLQFLQMVNSGTSVEQARNFIAEDIKCSPVLTRSYRHWAHTKNGKEILRKLTWQWRTYGVEPPFAEVVNISEICPHSPISA